MFWVPVKWALRDIPALCRLILGLYLETRRGQVITLVIDPSEEGAVDSALARLRLRFPILLIMSWAAERTISCRDRKLYISTIAYKIFGKGQSYFSLLHHRLLPPSFLFIKRFHEIYRLHFILKVSRRKTYSLTHPLFLLECQS